MAFETKMNPWGQLISLRETAFMFNLYNRTYSFGRGPIADSRFTSKHFDQKLLSCISNLHFRLKQNSNEITLENLSTNGTYINGELVAKNEIRSLNNYDEISLSLPNRKAFIFHHCLHKKSEDYPDVINDKYYISKSIGNGASGQVRLAFLKSTLEKCAVKILQKKNSSSSNKDSSYMLQIDNEIKILQTINHAFIISLKECIHTEASIYIVMELAEEGDLLEHIKEQKRLPESEVKLYFYQLALAVQHLHENGITHRDVKLENITLSRVDNIPVIKLSDLGLSAVGISELQGKCGSISYMAPEMLSTSRSYTNKVDMWSLGVVLFTCLAGFLPFCSNDTRSLETTISKCQYKMDHTLWKGVSTHAKNLIKKLLVKDPEKRYGISETLNHQWLKDKEVISSGQNLLRKDKKIGSKRKNEFPEENNENMIFMNKKICKEKENVPANRQVKKAMWKEELKTKEEIKEKLREENDIKAKKDGDRDSMGRLKFKKKGPIWDKFNLLPKDPKFVYNRVSCKTCNKKLTGSVPIMKVHVKACCLSQYKKNDGLDTSISKDGKSSQTKESCDETINSSIVARQYSDNILNEIATAEAGQNRFHLMSDDEINDIEMRFKKESLEKPSSADVKQDPVISQKENKGATKFYIDKETQDEKAIKKNTELLLNHENRQDALKEVQIISAKSKTKSKRDRKKNVEKI